jgi:hypothetical protein
MKFQSCLHAGDRQRADGLRLLTALIATTILSGCITTSMEGYADRIVGTVRPARRVRSVAFIDIMRFAIIRAAIW